MGRYPAAIEHGVPGPDDGLELLEGVPVEKMSKNPPRRAESRSCLSAGRSKRSRRRGGVQKPGAADVAIVFGISAASLKRDRALKKRIHAAARIPDYSILNLVRRSLEVDPEPEDGESYASGNIPAR